MTLLNWMGEHPILTVVLAYFICATITDIGCAIGNGLSGKSTGTPWCSKPSEPVEYSSKPEQHSRSASAMRPDIGQGGSK